MLKAAVIAVMLVGLAAQAQADEDPAAQASRWTDLKHSLFGDKTVIEGSNVIALEAPARALDAATVPISVTLPGNGEHMSGRIKTVWIVVDGNPSPVAGAFHFGPDAVLHTLKTRVRVEQYTLIHAVAETEDGRLFSAARYVKGAGGCAAPSTKDPKVAMSRLGQMKVRLADNAVAAEGEAVTVKLLISHPNNNGMQMDQLTHYYIPPRYIQDIAVHYGKSLVMNVDTDISLSQDPVFTFGLRLQGNGPLHVDMEDSTHAKFHQDFDLVRGKLTRKVGRVHHQVWTLPTGPALGRLPPANLLRVAHASAADRPTIIAKYPQPQVWTLPTKPWTLPTAATTNQWVT